MCGIRIRSFLAPMDENQPYLDSALARIEAGGRRILISRGVASERIAILGIFSGRVPALEFAARHPRKFGGAVMAHDWRLIGPPGTPRDYEGSLDGTPVFIGSGDPDPHVPFERVLESEKV